MDTKKEIDEEKLERAAEIARKIDADLDYKIEEDELYLLQEISGRDQKEFEAQMRAIKFLEKKKRDQKKNDDARFMYVILVYLCRVDPLVAAALCAVPPSMPFI